MPVELEVKGWDWRLETVVLAKAVAHRPKRTERETIIQAGNAMACFVKLDVTSRVWHKKGKKNPFSRIHLGEINAIKFTTRASTMGYRHLRAHQVPF